MQDAFDDLDDVLEDLRNGEMVIVTDDAHSESEGELVMAAERVTPDAVSFLATRARGLICVALTSEQATVLGLQRMVGGPLNSRGTDFTHSVDAARGILQGKSVGDRARTIKLLANPKSTPGDFVSPGHVFSIQVTERGVLGCARTAEAGVDLMRLAGLTPVAVICELTNKDGSMMRPLEVEAFRRRRRFRMMSICTLIAHRRELG